MRILKLLAVAGVAATLAASASAQFSVSGAGSLIPASGTGGGGSYPTTLPGTPAISTVTVSAAVVNIDSIVINDIAHTWSGDTQATLADPNGVEHLIWLRPGLAATGGFGSSGDFTGTITMVESGGAAIPITGDIAPGTYNQAFDSGNGNTWNSGDAGILNTRMGSISGPAGTWTLRIYDWGSGDTGSFTGWTLNGIGAPVDNTGSAYCFGDGSNGDCPCSNNGATGAGCQNSGGTAAVLSASGNAEIANDTFTLDVTGALPGAFCLFVQGDNQLVTPLGNGYRCVQVERRGPVAITDASGAASRSGLGADVTVGQTRNYQVIYRDTADTCGGGFNYSNGWTVTWN
jgi:subtilisin-like proprotein convertase family protein